MELPMGQGRVSPQLMLCTPGRKEALAVPAAAQPPAQPSLQAPTTFPSGQYCPSFPLNAKYSRQQVTQQFSYSKTQNKNTTWAKVSTRHTPGAAGGLPGGNNRGLQQGQVNNAAGRGQKGRSSQRAPNAGQLPNPPLDSGQEEAPHKTALPHWHPKGQSPLPRGPNWTPAECNRNQTYLAEPTSQAGWVLVSAAESHLPTTGLCFQLDQCCLGTLGVEVQPVWGSPGREK